MSVPKPVPYRFRIRQVQEAVHRMAAAVPVRGTNVPWNHELKKCDESSFKSSELRQSQLKLEQKD